MKNFRAQKYAGSFTFTPIDDDGNELPDVTIRILAMTDAVFEQVRRFGERAKKIEKEINDAAIDQNDDVIIEKSPEYIQMIHDQITLLCPEMTQEYLVNVPVNVKREMLEYVFAVSNGKVEAEDRIAKSDKKKL